MEPSAFLRKLIIGFLILAIGTSTSAFLLSGVISNRETRSSVQEGASEEKIARVPTNAFVEPLPEARVASPQTTPEIPAALDPENLTSQLAKEIGDRIVETNPSGPTQEAGEERLLAPSVDNIVTGIVNQSSLAKIEQLAASRAKRKATFVVAPDSPEEAVTYLEALEKALHAYETRIQPIEDSKELNSPEVGEATKIVLLEVIGAIEKIPRVPHSLVESHEALHDMLRSNYDAIDVNVGSEDPVQEMFLSQVKLSLLEESYGRLQEALDRLDSLEPLSLEPNTVPPLSRLFQNLFSHKVALAATESILDQTVNFTEPAIRAALVGDCGEDPVDSLAKFLGRQIEKAIEAVKKFIKEKVIGKAKEKAKQAARQAVEEQVQNLTSLTAVPVSDAGTQKKIAKSADAITDNQCAIAKTKKSQNIWLEAIKNDLVHRIVKQTIAWIQGGGRPQFITNWKGFLKDVANEAGGDVIQQVLPQLCRGFGPLIRVAFQPVGLITRPVTCTLDQVVRNVRDFYEDFTKGGWIAYGASLRPENNFFGVLALTGDAVVLQTKQAKEAAKSQAEASGGYRSQEVCVRQRVFNQFQQCRAIFPETPEECDPATDINEKICVEWRTTTPGRTLADIVEKTLPSPLEKIVNAQDWYALVAAVLNSALDKLVKTIDGKPDERGLLGINARTIGNVNPGDLPVTPPPDGEGGRCGPDAARLGCRCTGPGGEPGLPPNDLRDSDFEWRSVVDAAQRQVEATAAQQCQANGTNTAGLLCSESPDFTSVADALTYTGAVAQEITANAGGGLRGGVVQADEVGVADGTPPKSEHYDIVASSGIWINEIAICTPPISPPF